MKDRKLTVTSRLRKLIDMGEVEDMEEAGAEVGEAEVWAFLWLPYQRVATDEQHRA